jgi:hypothetical protein
MQPFKVSDCSRTQLPMPLFGVDAGGFKIKVSRPFNSNDSPRSRRFRSFLAGRNSISNL